VYTFIASWSAARINSCTKVPASVLTCHFHSWEWSPIDRCIHAVRILDQTRAWNLQQGTMLFWNPDAPETQLFFNDLDPKTGVVYTV
jgi:hypothetical protein